MRYVLRRKYLWIKVGVCMGWFGDFSILRVGVGWVGLGCWINTILSNLIVKKKDLIELFKLFLSIND